MDNYKLNVKTELTCNRCRAVLETYDAVVLEGDDRVASRMEAHSKACPDVRIEAYIAEIFPNIEDVTGASVGESVIRDYNLGRTVSRLMQLEKGVTVEDAMRTISDWSLEKFQAVFGVKSRSVKFYWRERPTFGVWKDPDTRSIHVGLWLRFGLEGWKYGQSLAEFLGVSDSPLSSMTQVSEFGGLNYIEPRSNP